MDAVEASILKNRAAPLDPHDADGQGVAAPMEAHDDYANRC